MIATTSEDRRVYVTIRDPQTKKSRTITVRGPRMTADRLISVIRKALRADLRKAG